MKGMTSSGLLLLLVGVVGLSAFINGALPSLLDALFSAKTTPGGATGAGSGVPAVARPGSVGHAAIGKSA